jgi:hypothetical protein
VRYMGACTACGLVWLHCILKKVDRRIVGSWIVATIRYIGQNKECTVDIGNDTGNDIDIDSGEQVYHKYSSQLAARVGPCSKVASNSPLVFNNNNNNSNKSSSTAASDARLLVMSYRRRRPPRRSQLSPEHNSILRLATGDEAGVEHVQHLFGQDSISGDVERAAKERQVWDSLRDEHYEGSSPPSHTSFRSSLMSKPSTRAAPTISAARICTHSRTRPAGHRCVALIFT